MAAKLFISYSREDETYKNKLLDHLALLVREGRIELWHDRRIEAGEDFTRVIEEEIDSAQIILLLISSSFTKSDYCSRELERAMERHHARAAHVVPVIVRPCEWRMKSFGSLNAVPKDGRAITLWRNEDAACLDVARAIRRLVNKAPSRQVSPPPQPPPRPARPPRWHRYLAPGIAVLFVLAGLAAWQHWRGSAPQTSAPATLTMDPTALPPASAEPAKSPTRSAPARNSPPHETAAPPTSTADRESGSVRDTGVPSSTATTPADRLDIPQGVTVIAEVAAVAAPGLAWDPGTLELAPLPDLMLCFRPQPAGKEVCRRARAGANVSHAAETFADLQSWNETFRLELKNSDSRWQSRSMGTALCHFGRPCVVASTGDGRIPIAEVLVLPALQVAGELHTRYLQRCVDAGSILAQQWTALLAASGNTAPAVSRISYGTLAQTFLAIADNEITEDLLGAALDAGSGRGQLAGVRDTFRGTLLQAALYAEGWNRTQRKRIDSSIDTLRQGLAQADSARFLVEGCH